MPELTLQHRFHCVSPRAALWPKVTDTNLLNQLSGMSTIDMEPLDDGTAARFLVRTRLDGFPVVYSEPPYEWQTPRWFQVHRELRTGPTSWLRMRYQLEDADDGGTLITLDLRLFPKFLLLMPVARFLGNRRLKSLGDAISAIDLMLHEDAKRASAVPGTRAAAVVPTQAFQEGLAPGQTAAADKLLDLIQTGHSAELLRIRPYELADRWGMRRRDVLDVCLIGVEEGILDLYWDLICPSCQTAATRVHHLWELEEGGHCQLCEISFDLPLDEAVEATFRPKPNVRQVEDVQFCSGGPAMTPHVFSQFVLPANGTTSLTSPATPAGMRLFVRGGQVVDVVVHADGPTTATVDVGPDGSSGETLVAPEGTLLVNSHFPDERHLKLEYPGWQHQAATAFELSTHPRFRRQFSSEVLAAGRSHKIGRVALMFSDLTGSTALYTAKGDAVAYRLVQQHFDLLNAVIAEHDGTVVKTIGDAVMAAFVEDGDALRCALEVLRRWPAFLADKPQAEGLTLKIGVHSGPCYAVTANGVLDYFGQTVNVAARLQGQAAPDEVVVAETLADHAVSQDWLGGARVSERWEAALKGIDGGVRAARVRVR